MLSTRLNPSGTYAFTVDKLATKMSIPEIHEPLVMNCSERAWRRLPNISLDVLQ
jgi:hypothetical protein